MSQKYIFRGSLFNKKCHFKLYILFFHEQLFSAVLLAILALPLGMGFSKKWTFVYRDAKFGLVEQFDQILHIGGLCYEQNQFEILFSQEGGNNKIDMQLLALFVFPPYTRLKIFQISVQLINTSHISIVFFNEMRLRNINSCFLCFAITFKILIWLLLDNLKLLGQFYYQSNVQHTHLVYYIQS